METKDKIPYEQWLNMSPSWRLGILAFGPAWQWQSRTKFFKGHKLTKLGKEQLELTIIINK